MKKFNIFLLGALGLLAGACAEDIEPSKPQQNPQEPILNSAEDVVSEKAGVLASTDIIALEDYNQPEATIPVMKLVSTKNLPAGASIVYKMELSPSASFQNVRTLVASPSAADPAIYTVDAAEWQQAQIDLFGNTVKVQTCYYRIPVYLSLSGSEYRLESTDYYCEEGQFQITRMYPGYDLEEEYFVFGNYVGGNSPATAVKMIHSDKDVYDDPTFNYIFNVTEAQASNGFTLMVAPGSLHTAQATASQCFGTNTPNATAGSLIVGGEAMTVYNPGPYRLSVNMKDLTYTLAVAPENLYPFYGTVKAENILKLYTSDFMNYSGVTVINNKWTLAGQPDKKGAVVFRQPKDATPTVSEDGLSQTGVLTQEGDATDLTTPVTGKYLYWANVSLIEMTYNITAIKTLNVVGNFNNWGAGGPAFTANKDLDVWTAQNVVLDGGEFKFRANDAWDVNFGDAGTSANPLVMTLAPNGENFCKRLPMEAGTYDIVIDFSVYPYVATFTKK